MFSSGPNYNKLKTNLRLAINRLKLLEKKKTEMALKSRKEIAGKYWTLFGWYKWNWLLIGSLQTTLEEARLREPRSEWSTSSERTTWWVIVLIQCQSFLYHLIHIDRLQVEAMEVLEMYCDLLLARFGLIQQVNTQLWLDDTKLC